MPARKTNVNRNLSLNAALQREMMSARENGNTMENGRNARRRHILFEIKINDT